MSSVPIAPDPSPAVLAAIPAPWWRFPMVWLVLAGPAIVVAACVVTMVIAFRHADVVLTEAPARAAARGVPLAGATAPALQARNHAATPAR